jgi:hypothetical protein
MPGSTKKYVVRYYEIDVPNDLAGTGLENAIKSVYNDEGDRQNILSSPDAVAVFISHHYTADTVEPVVNCDVMVFDNDPVIEAPYKQVELPFADIEKAIGSHVDDFLDMTSGKFEEGDFDSPEENGKGTRSMKYLVQIVDAPDAEFVRSENELLK